MTVPWQRVMLVELAEAAAEVNVLLARYSLIAKQKNAVIEKRAIDFAELLLGHVTRYIDVANFCAKTV